MSKRPPRPRLRVPDLDAALGWAARCPCAGDAAVEVRPLLPAGMR